MDSTSSENRTDARISRKQLLTIWTVLISVLGTSIVPKVMDLLSDRPSVTDVQDMIAEQTKVLTSTVNKNIDRLDSLDGAKQKIENDVSYLSGLVTSVRDVLRDCCTRRNVSVVKLDKPSAATKTPTKVKESAQDVQQEKLPEFNPRWIQQKSE